MKVSCRLWKYFGKGWPRPSCQKSAAWGGQTPTAQSFEHLNGSRREIDKRVCYWKWSQMRCWKQNIGCDSVQVFFALRNFRIETATLSTFQKSCCIVVFEQAIFTVMTVHNDNIYNHQKSGSEWPFSRSESTWPFSFPPHQSGGNGVGPRYRASNKCNPKQIVEFKVHKYSETCVLQSCSRLVDIFFLASLFKKSEIPLWCEVECV